MVKRKVEFRVPKTSTSLPLHRPIGPPLHEQSTMLKAAKGLFYKKVQNGHTIKTGRVARLRRKEGEGGHGGELGGAVDREWGGH